MYEPRQPPCDPPKSAARRQRGLMPRTMPRTIPCSSSPARHDAPRHRHERHRTAVQPGHRRQALIDTLYIATRKRRRFASLPEVDMGEVDRAELQGLLDVQVRPGPIRSAIERRLTALEGVQWYDSKRWAG